MGQKIGDIAVSELFVFIDYDPMGKLFGFLIIFFIIPYFMGRGI